ncbi:MAG TPA: hypothetical protein VD908_11915 [Cytophagales bacterium]|nr:hypothetical protein [Cytophagales bacterium]
MSKNIEKIKMSGLGEVLIKKLNKIYPASQRIDGVFKGNDITFVTNEYGEPVTLYIGKRTEDGSIKGDLFVRKIIRTSDGKSIEKSHWDNKGKVTRFKG